MIGDRVLGMDVLGGEWMDGMPRSVEIDYNDPEATILAIPEPGGRASSIWLVVLEGCET